MQMHACDGGRQEDKEFIEGQIVEQAQQLQVRILIQNAQAAYRQPRDAGYCTSIDQRQFLADLAAFVYSFGDKIHPCGLGRDGTIRPCRCSAIDANASSNPAHVRLAQIVDEYFSCYHLTSDKTKQNKAAMLSL